MSMMGSGYERRDQAADAGGQATTRLRVYELAKELGLAPKDMVAKIRSLGVEIANHMSHLEAAEGDRIRRAIERERHESLIEERLSPTVIRRRARNAAPAGAPAPPPSAVPAEKAPAPAVPLAPAVAARPVEAPAPPPPPPPAPAPMAAREPEPEPPAVVTQAPPRPLVTPPPAPSLPVAPPPSAVATTPEPPPPARPAPSPVRAPLPRFVPAPVLSAPPEPQKVFKVIPQPVVTGSAATGQFIQLPGRQAPGVPRIEITNRDEELRRLGRSPLQTRPGGLPGPGGRPFGGPGGRPGGPMAKKRVAPPGKKVKQTQITVPAEHKRVVKMGDTIGVSELAQRMGIKGGELVKKLWALGMMGVNINQSIDHDTATLLANEFGYQIESVAFKEESVISEGETDSPEDLVARAPVVTVMGHVDHGKTSLLDAIRKANVAAGEAGGITQHIGAYRVHTPGGDVVFLDTPGHEAFTAMRARGAKMTDIVVLVVAADDGPMPQTIEAINHARAAEVPIVVAVNKVDKPGANPQQIRTKLMEQHLVPEEFGGDTIFIDVSAKTKQGIDKLLEMLALQAEVLELKANPKKVAKGHVVEARLDRARGAIANLLVEEGTMRVGDIVVAGEVYGKIRAMLNDKGQQVTEAPPSTPVEVLGLDGVPDAGETFNVVTDEKAAKQLAEHRRDLRKKKESASQGRVSLENILDKIKEGEVPELKIVLKADVQGSVEAIANALRALGTPTVGVAVISQGVGGITESDVTLAKASSAVIIGFNVRPAGKSQAMAEQEGVDIKLYQIIYEAIDDVKKAMLGMLEPVTREKVIGKVEVRQTFNITKVGTIAGCFVIDGKVTRKSQVRLVRDSVVVFTGKLGSLKRFKDDASEVAQGYECGLQVEGYQDVKVGDIIEAFEIETVAPSLDQPVAAKPAPRGQGGKR
jgi:translation initiation factor IF-2